MKRMWRSMYSAPRSVLRRGMAEKAADGTFNFVHPMSSLHMIRDGEPMLNLSDIFARRFKLAGTLVNLPPDVFGLPGDNSGEFHGLGAPSPTPTMDGDDLIVQATRFPLDDNPVFDNQAVIRSGSPLETRIANALRRLFLHCARNAVILSDEVAEQCDPSALDYRAVQFSTRSDERTRRISGYAMRAGNVSQVQFVDRCPELPGPWTIGYIAFIPAIGPEPKSPAFLNVFGLHGTGTLLWSIYVRQSLSRQVLAMVRERKPRVLVYRFQPRFEGPYRPSCLSLLTNGQPQVLVDVALSTKTRD